MTDRTVDLGQLNQLLWQYRPLLERFEFLLEVQLMVTASGRQDWQRHMADLFQENFKSYADGVSAEVLAAGPSGKPVG